MLASSTDPLLAEALGHLSAALELLDRAQAPGDIGAHVEHARERIEETLNRPGGPRASTNPGPWD